MQHVLFMKVQCTQNFYLRVRTFLLEGAGWFGVAWWSSEGVVRRSSVTARVSTADSTLIVWGGVIPLALWPHSSLTQFSLLIKPRKKKNAHNEQRSTM